MQQPCLQVRGQVAKAASNIKAASMFWLQAAWWRGQKLLIRGNEEHNDKERESVGKNAWDQGVLSDYNWKSQERGSKDMIQSYRQTTKHEL